MNVQPRRVVAWLDLVRGNRQYCHHEFRALLFQVLARASGDSQFALQRSQKAGAKNIAYAEFVHILQVRAPLVGDALARAQRLLRYGPQQQMPAPAGTRSYTVLRRGTISPWSSRPRIFLRCPGCRKLFG